MLGRFPPDVEKLIHQACAKIASEHGDEVLALMERTKKEIAENMQTGRQVLLLLKAADGGYADIMSGDRWEVREVAGG